jgi:hypothetical protein
MTPISRNLPDQTATARPSRRSSQSRPQLRKTRDTGLPAGKISLKPRPDRPPVNPFAETKWRSLDHPDSGPNAIPHRSVTEENRR